MSLEGRYHILTQPAPLLGEAPAPFEIAEDGNYVKYGHTVFQGKSARGDDYWTTEIVTQTWYMAETGRIPISGAGYGGRFAGEGFEGIWLDMSEIVRPTRDGIHGRETISTEVEIGASVSALSFDAAGRLITQMKPWLTLPIPLIFNLLDEELPGRGTVIARAQAAAELGTLALISPAEWAADLAPYARSLAFRVESLEDIPAGLTPRYLEFGSLPDLAEVEAALPDSVPAVRLALGPGAGAQAVEWVEAGLRVIHLYADEVGRDSAGRPLPDAMRELHLALVEAGIRDRVTLLVSGGVAAAEHVAKIVACGADLVAIDLVMLIAWGTSLWADKGSSPIEDEDFDADWGAQRLLNLINAWRDQLLEALGGDGHARDAPPAR